jgi:septum formation protein
MQSISTLTPAHVPTEVVLASASPRRRALLCSAGLRVTVSPTHAEEVWLEELRPEAAILQVVRDKLAGIPPHVSLVLAADTVVLLDGAVLGKPTDAAHAQAMLARLAGRTHHVMTGFILRSAGAPYGSGWTHAQTVTTAVTFRALSGDDIARYVACGESIDKAGGYGIQGEGGSLVASISGSYTNVVGLPLPEVLAALARAPREHL